MRKNNKFIVAEVFISSNLEERKEVFNEKLLNLIKKLEMKE